MLLSTGGVRVSSQKSLSLVWLLSYSLDREILTCTLQTSILGFVSGCMLMLVKTGKFFEGCVCVWCCIELRNNYVSTSLLRSHGSLPLWQPALMCVCIKTIFGAFKYSPYMRSLVLSAFSSTNVAKRQQVICRKWHRSVGIWLWEG